MPELRKVIAKLKKHFGAAALPPAKGPFELVMWENACTSCRTSVALSSLKVYESKLARMLKAILKADPDILLALAAMGGMRPKVRGISLAGDCTNHHEPV